MKLHHHVISDGLNTEFWSLSSDLLSGYNVHKGPSIFNLGLVFFNSFFFTSTHWFWTGIHDFSQDESQDSTL